MKLTGENRSTWGKPCPNATLSTTNRTQTDPGSHPSLRRGRPAANRLSHGTALRASRAICTGHMQEPRCGTGSLSSGVLSCLGGGGGINHPPPLSAEVKERVVIPLLPTRFWTFMACYGAFRCCLKISTFSD
jgi:hypothetical protein